LHRQRVQTHLSIKNKRLEALARGAGPQDLRGPLEVTSFSYLPTTFTTLFFLAASLLLGYM
jgi:hypothetical protein